jgi:tetratricopeptide (TPR) repeat protein
VRRWPAAAAGAALLLVALVMLLRVRAGRVDVAPDSAAAPAGAKAGIAEFWQVYRLATEHRVAGRIGEALDAYSRALELNLRHEDALYYLGNMHLELGHYQAARTAWERLADVNPGSSRAHSRLGDLHACLELGAPLDLSRAEAEFRRASEINREETGPLLRLGEVALIRGDLSGATQHLDAVIGSNHTSVEGHFLKGYVAWKRGEPDRAAALFAQAAEFARSAQPAPSLPGEGDTKRGLAPMVARTSRCQAFQALIDALPQAAEASLSAHMTALYQQLDARLTQFLPRAPS